MYSLPLPRFSFLIRFFWMWMWLWSPQIPCSEHSFLSKKRSWELSSWLLFWGRKDLHMWDFPQIQWKWYLKGLNLTDNHKVKCWNNVDSNQGGVTQGHLYWCDVAGAKIWVFCWLVDSALTFTSAIKECSAKTARDMNYAYSPAPSHPLTSLSGDLQTREISRVLLSLLNSWKIFVDN